MEIELRYVCTEENEYSSEVINSSEVNYGALFVLFDKSRLMPASNFSFTFPHQSVITHTLQHIQIHSSYTSQSYRHTSLCNVTRRNCTEIGNGFISSIRSNAGLKQWKVRRVPALEDTQIYHIYTIFKSRRLRRQGK